MEPPTRRISPYVQAANDKMLHLFLMTVSIVGPISYSLLPAVSVTRNIKTATADTASNQYFIVQVLCPATKVEPVVHCNANKGGLTCMFNQILACAKKLKVEQSEVERNPSAS